MTWWHKELGHQQQWCCPNGQLILKKNGPKEDLDNFLSAHLTNPYQYSVNLAEQKQTPCPSPLRSKEAWIFHICHEQRNDTFIRPADKNVRNWWVHYFTELLSFHWYTVCDIWAKEFCMGVCGTPCQNMEFHVANVDYFQNIPIPGLMNITDRILYYWTAFAAFKTDAMHSQYFGSLFQKVLMKDTLYFTHEGEICYCAIPCYNRQIHIISV